MNVLHRVYKDKHVHPASNTVHARIQEFLPGGPGLLTEKSSDNFFKSSTYFIIGVQWFILRKTILIQGSRGGPTFGRGVQLFPGGGGPNAYYPQTKSEGYSFGVVRPSIPSVRPDFLSVRNHISVPIGQI